MFLFFYQFSAHKWGDKPYDKYINPVENKSVAIFALGEGWHNYHHVFPCNYRQTSFVQSMIDKIVFILGDYKTAELGNYRMNMTTAFIDFFAKIGWAYDMKTVSRDIIKRRVERTGNGNHNLWGWGDKDHESDEKKLVQIVNKED